MKMTNQIRRKIIHEHHRQTVLSRHQSEGPFPYILVLDSLKAGFNIPKIFRSANAFGCCELHLVNIPVFDPSPGRGTVKQTRSKSFNSVAESFSDLQSRGYTIFALDPLGTEALGRLELPEKSAFVVGHEEYGFSFEPQQFPFVKRLKIVQFGKVQSLNVAVAASLVSYEWVRQRGLTL